MARNQYDKYAEKELSRLLLGYTGTKKMTEAQCRLFLDKAAVLVEFGYTLDNLPKDAFDDLRNEIDAENRTESLIKKTRDVNFPFSMKFLKLTEDYI